MSSEEATLSEELSPIEYQRLREKGVTKIAADPSADGAKAAPKTEVPPEVPEDQEADPEPASESETEQVEDEEAEKPKAKGGFQRRIDKLTSKLRLTEQERDDLREAQKQKAAETKPQPTNDKPLRENFVTEDEWIDAYADWRDAKKELEARRRDEKERFKSVLTNFNKQLDAEREAHDDFDEVVGSPVEIPKSVELAIPHLENGAAVAYHLGKNPDIAAKLMDMDPLQAVAYVGRISAELSLPSNGNRSPDKKPASKASAPITPVDTGSSRSSVALEDLSPSEYIKRRNAEREKKRAY
jgi:hypothetical protein